MPSTGALTQHRKVNASANRPAGSRIACFRLYETAMYRRSTHIIGKKCRRARWRAMCAYFGDCEQRRQEPGATAPSCRSDWTPRADASWREIWLRLYRLPRPQRHGAYSASCGKNNARCKRYTNDAGALAITLSQEKNGLSTPGTSR